MNPWWVVVLVSAGLLAALLFWCWRKVELMG